MRRKFIKELVDSNIATDITNYSYEEALKCISKYNYRNVSYGKYGMNAALFINRQTGKMYAVLARNSLLFQLV